MTNLDREPIAFGQLALNVSLLAFALLLYLISFGGPSQHLAELCVLALSFGAFKIRPVEILETGETVGLGHAQVSKPQVPTVRVRLLGASLKPVTLPRPMPRVGSATPTVASATGQPAELELSEIFPDETTPSAAPQADTIAEKELSVETVAVESIAFEPRLWMQEVEDIARRHTKKFKFTLGPLVFGPQDEVMPVIDACFWPGSHSAVTRRTREIILLGREQYTVMHADCSQKIFIYSVMKAHEDKLAASRRPQPGYDVYRDTLTGKSSSVSKRLRTAMPVD
jgi:hypothetical protein